MRKGRPHIKGMQCKAVVVDPASLRIVSLSLCVSMRRHLTWPRIGWAGFWYSTKKSLRTTTDCLIEGLFPLSSLSLPSLSCSPCSSPTRWPYLYNNERSIVHRSLAMLKRARKGGEGRRPICEDGSAPLFLPPVINKVVCLHCSKVKQQSKLGEGCRRQPAVCSSERRHPPCWGYAL